MDGHRFDDLVRSFADRPTRRRALKILAGGAAGGLAALVGRSAGAAPRCQRVGQRCHTSEDCCPGPTRNGNVSCAETRICQRCPSTARTACGGACVDVLTDPTHCGACDRICPTGAICSGGTCCAPEPASTTCAGKDCGAALNNCGQSVVCGPDTCDGIGQSCGGGGAPNVCGCTDNGLACQGKDCGEVINNCGEVDDCGTCTGTGGTCGGGGVPNVCGGTQQ